MEADYRVGAIGNVFFAYWKRAPTADALRDALRVAIEARHAAGRALVFVLTVAGDAGMPDARAMRQMVHGTRALEQFCELHVTSVVGDGLQARVMRGLIAGFSFTVRNPVIMVASAGEAVRVACARAGMDPDATAELARERGLVPP